MGKSYFLLRPAAAVSSNCSNKSRVLLRGGGTRPLDLITSFHRLQCPPTAVTRLFSATYTSSTTSQQPQEQQQQQAEPTHDLHLDQQGIIQWSVLPQTRVRSHITNRLWINRYLQRKESARVSAVSGDQVPEAPITNRSMKDSYVEVFLPFASDPSAREDYVNAYGSIRIGKILEDLDALAGSIAYTHCDDGRDDTPPLTIVTASLDRIDMVNRIPTDMDVSLSGFVTHVGTSSMEISIKMETVPEGVTVDTVSGECRAKEIIVQEEGDSAANSAKMMRKPILAAKFTMVARDPVTLKAAAVNTLRLESDEERRLFKLATEQKARKKFEKDTSLSKVPPSTEEMTLVHSLYKEYIKYLDPSYQVAKPANVVWMKDTIQNTLVMCQPQDRNIHNKIFGGYLMKLAYELGYSTALTVTKSRVYFVSLDDVTFRRPVPIGCLLSLTSQVVYATGHPSRSLIVKVRADVCEPLKGTKETSNEFWFTFMCPTDGAVPRIMPRSYDESMRYLDGKRRKDAFVVAASHNTALFGSDRLKAWEE